MVEYFSPRSYGDVEAIKMGRKVLGHLIYPAYAYRIDNLLIDTGPIVTSKKMLEYCKLNEVENILITHGDEDHIGGLRLLRENLGCHSYAPEGALKYIHNPIKLELYLYQRIGWGVPEATDSEILEVESEISLNGRKILPFQTPGHRNHHTSFFFKDEGWMFTGDLVCGRKVRTLFQYEDYDQIYNSIERMVELEPEIIFCAFRGKIGDPMEFLEFKLDFMAKTKKSILDLHKQGLSSKKIRNKVLGREGMMARLTYGDLSKINLIKSVLKNN